jgi:cyclophilin family peptidyl-prolyl cis-trans isomerase
LSKTENNVLIPMFSVRLPLLALISPLALLLESSSLWAAPVVSGQIPNLTVFDATPAAEIDLNTKFSDPDLPAKTVRLTTVLGDIDVTLYDQQTPITVDNFLRYIDSGAYIPTDPNFQTPAPIFFHRSVPNFVIQSGGYVSTQNPADPPTVLPGPVTTFSPIPNEARPDLHNVRGTIAMAKLPDDPNSATSQWFINLADNSGDPSNLDTVNGGFTVFGTVSAAGMTTADAIAALPVYNAGGIYGAAFTELPLRNFSSGLPEVDNLVLINDITRPLIFSAVSDHPAIASASVISNDLFVQGKTVGTATITVTGTDANGATASQSFDITVTGTPVHAANISTRLQVASGDDALIGGFIVGGDASKRVMIRAIGPSLEVAGVSNALSNPTLELHDGTGALIASNDNWQNALNKRDLINTGLAPADANEAAILTTLAATSSGSAYTAVMRSVDGTSGIGLVEVYDLDSGPGSSLLNISTRGNVQTGDNVMIGGFIVAGNGSQQLLVRAIGPSLAAAGVPDTLADPTLTLYDSQGTQIDFNDNWQDNPAQAEIEATMISPNDPKESAVLPTLAPGGYTAIVRGAGTSTGTALVDVYVLAATQP